MNKPAKPLKKKKERKPHAHQLYARPLTLILLPFPITLENKQMLNTKYINMQISKTFKPAFANIVIVKERLIRLSKNLFYSRQIQPIGKQ